MIGEVVCVQYTDVCMSVVATMITCACPFVDCFHPKTPKNTTPNNQLARPKCYPRPRNQPTIPIDCVDLTRNKGRAQMANCQLVQPHPQNGSEWRNSAKVGGGALDDRVIHSITSPFADVFNQCISSAPPFQIQSY